MPTKFRQVVSEISADITSGKLKTGAKLPPHRDLAYQRGILHPQTDTRIPRTNRAPGA